MSSLTDVYQHLEKKNMSPSSEANIPDDRDSMLDFREVSSQLSDYTAS
jgi:hypothetical protein